MRHALSGRAATAKRLIDEGAIGDLRFIRVTSSVVGYLPDELGWVKDPGEGGAWLDMGVHLFDAMRWFTGSDVDTVFAAVRDFSGVEHLRRTGMAQLTLRDGIFAQVLISFEMPAPGLGSQSQWTFVGADGIIESDFVREGPGRDRRDVGGGVRDAILRAQCRRVQPGPAEGVRGPGRGFRGRHPVGPGVDDARGRRTSGGGGRRGGDAIGGDRRGGAPAGVGQVTGPADRSGKVDVDHGAPIVVLDGYPLDATQRTRLEAVSPRYRFIHRPIEDQATIDAFDGAEVEVLLAEYVPLDLAAWPRLRWVQYSGAGVDPLGAQAPWRRGVTVTTASGGNASPIREYVLGWLLHHSSRSASCSRTGDSGPGRRPACRWAVMGSAAGR